VNEHVNIGLVVANHLNSSHVNKGMFTCEDWIGKVEDDEFEWNKG